MIFSYLILQHIRSVIYLHLLYLFIMFVSPHKKRENAFNAPFFRREVTFDMQMNTSSSYNYKYTLLGVAKVNASGMEIYDTYFLNRYNKKYYYDQMIK